MLREAWQIPVLVLKDQVAAVSVFVQGNIVLFACLLLFSVENLKLPCFFASGFFEWKPSLSLSLPDC